MRITASRISRRDISSAFTLRRCAISAPCADTQYTHIARIPRPSITISGNSAGAEIAIISGRKAFHCDFIVLSYATLEIELLET